MELNVNNINFGKRKVNISSGNADELIKKLELNDDSVILVGKSGRIYTKDEKINENEITVIEVFSGG